MDKNKHLPINTEQQSHCRNSRISNTIQSIGITEKEHQSPTPILHGSRCRYQQYRENQSESHPQPVMAKCKSQHMHIPHDSRSEGKKTKCGNTIRYCELQSPRTLTSPKGSCSGLCRKRLQGRRSVRNLHHGTTGEENYPEIGYQKENSRKSSVNCSRTHSCKKTMIS